MIDIEITTLFSMWAQVNSLFVKDDDDIAAFHMIMVFILILCAAIRVI